MKKLLVTLAVLSGSAFAQDAAAACRWVWSDHDFNAGTAPIRKQACDSVIDIPAIQSPSIPPIQRPQVRPIPQPTIPPISTSRCRMESVWNQYTKMWVRQQVCT